MAIIYCQGDNPLADGTAKKAAEILVQLYPNHSWWVEVKHGALIIKHFEISGLRGHIGMVRHLSQMGHDENVFRRELMRGAGELLERAGIKRGANNGDPVKKLELDVDLRKKWHPVLRPLRVVHE